MSPDRAPTQPPAQNEMSKRGIRLRLLAATVAGAAGVAALVIAILLLRSALA